MDLRKARRTGEDRSLFEKLSWGGILFAFLMLILILPMILFSSFNPSLVENKVLAGKLSINLQVKDPNSQITLYSLNIFDTSNLKVNSFEDIGQYGYLKNKLISNIEDVDERKVQKVKIVNYSQTDWILSPPAINSLLQQLEKKTKPDCFLMLEWEFKREFPPNNKIIAGNHQIQLNREQFATLRNIIFSLKTHQKPENFKIDLVDAFPKIIRLSNRQWKYLKFDSKHKTGHKENTDIELQLIKDNERDIYWKISQKEVKTEDDCKIYI
jgi:hypothetical protein